MVQEKKSKRLSRKLQKSYVIKTDIDELSDVLCELLKLLNIEELHIMTYKDRIDVFAKACLSFVFAGVNNTMNTFNGK